MTRLGAIFKLPAMELDAVAFEEVAEMGSITQDGWVAAKKKGEQKREDRMVGLELVSSVGYSVYRSHGLQSATVFISLRRDLSFLSLSEELAALSDFLIIMASIFDIKSKHSLRFTH